MDGKFGDVKNWRKDFSVMTIILLNNFRFDIYLSLISDIERFSRSANGIDVGNRSLEARFVDAIICEKFEPQKASCRSDRRWDRSSAVTSNERRKRPVSVSDLKEQSKS